jgi:hypothetical protein
VESDVQKTTLTPRVDLRDPGHRIGEEGAITDDTKAPGTLGEEHVSVRKEGHGPRVLEALGHAHQPIIRAVSGDDRGLACGRGHRREDQPDADERKGSASHVLPLRI